MLAVEPDLYLASLIERSSKTDLPTADVIVLAAAVSSNSGVGTLSIASRGRSSNSLGLGRSQMGGTRATQATSLVTLDALLECFRAPSVVKIDVEGLEHEVLKGGRRLLSDVRPLLIVEVGSENADAVGELLHNVGYLLFDGLDPSRTVSTPVWDTVAVPAESHHGT